MRAVLPGCLVGLALVGCESRGPASAVAAQPAATPPAANIAPPPDTANYTVSHYGFPTYHADSDTLILLGKRHYWLRMTLAADSTKPLDYAPAAVAGQPFAAPTDTAWQAHRVRGYEGTYTFTLRDSTRRMRVFRQRLHKRDFLRVGSRELVTVSDPQFQYLGYSAGLQALLFSAYFAIPDSDVCSRVTMLLDARSGRLRSLHNAGSASFEATDCDPQVSPSGRAIITCAAEVLRAGRPPISLRRPHAELHATRFLTDTTLLAVYTFGDYRPRQPDPAETGPTSDPTVSAGFSLPDEEFVSTPAQDRAANAFIIGTSGHVLSKFKYDGWEPGMGDVLPRHSSAITRTYYLVSENKDLVLLPKAQPGTFIKLPLKSMPKFQPPQRPQEFRFTLQNDTEEFTFYVDKTQPHAIRLRRVAY